MLRTYFIRRKRINLQTKRGLEKFRPSQIRVKITLYDEIVVIKLKGIYQESYDMLLTKLNKYGVKVYA